MNMLTKAAVQGASCGLVIGAVLLIGGRVWHPATAAAQGRQAAVADVIRARSFAVVGKQGELRLRLGVLPDGDPGLKLYDRRGSTRAALTLLPADGTPELTMYDTRGELLVALDGDSEQGASLGLYVRAGEPGAILEAGKPDEPAASLELYRAGDLAAYLDVADGSSLWLHDAKGKRRTVLGVQTEGPPGLRIWDASDKLIWQAP
jgi:hypothetical protein